MATKKTKIKNFLRSADGPESDPIGEIDRDRFVAMLHAARAFANIRALTGREVRAAIREVFEPSAPSPRQRVDARQLDMWIEWADAARDGS